ncbi:MAG: BTAD domain-containing putative transcriptional regulator [Acidimicrobiales bacterium]
MDFRILGPIEAEEGGELVDVGSKRQRALLALLLIHANRVVSSDHVLESLWGDDAMGKENAMWVAISRLRTALEPERTDRGESTLLVTRDHGYALEIPPESVDSHRFEAAIEAARVVVKSDPGTAAQSIDSALELWRGEPLGEFYMDEFAAVEVARLSDLYLEVLELRAETNLLLGRARSQISELESLTSAHPLRERFVELLMRSLYQSGQQADALRTYDRFRRTVDDELGIEPSPELRRLEEQILLHDPAVRRLKEAQTEAAPLEVENPFKGLRSFGEDDSEDFFGRDSLVSDVVRRLGSQPLVALVGASGSGKSSVVRAGVVPALRKGALPGSDRWLVAQMVPGAHPLAELEAALLRSTIDAPDSLNDALSDPDTGLVRAVLRLLPEDSCLVLVIDQFEELFTLVEDERDRQRFLDLLIPALEDPHGRIKVLLTLRADFYGRPLEYAEFSKHLGDSIVNVSTMSADELEEAAQAPAERMGVTLEPTLVASLLTDVVGQPGALPLFQYTLTSLFDRRSSDVITLEQYSEMGGIRGALTKRAEELFSNLGDAEQLAARQLFLRLVTISGEREWSRRRVRAAELTSMDTDLVAMQQTIEAFGNQRLLAFDRDQVTGSPTVEVAHEALLVEWPRLRAWIDEARDDVVRHAALVAALNEWQAAGQNPDYLLVGQRLTDYEVWARETLLELSRQETDFLNRSTAIRDDADRDEAERVDRESALARRAKRRAWGLAAVVLLILGTAAAWWFSRTDPGPRIAWIDTPSDQGSAIEGQFENGWQQAVSSSTFQPVRRTLRSGLDELVEIVDEGVDFVLLDMDNDFLVGEFSELRPGVRLATFFEGFPDLVPGQTNINIDDAAGSYLAGAAAALTSKTGTIGFVGGMPVVIDRFRAAYEAGARAADPDIRVISSYVSPDDGVSSVWNNLAAGAEGARRLFLADADVVFHAAGGTGDGIPRVAKDMTRELGRDLWVIGVDSDQYLAAGAEEGAFVLTSMVKHFDLVVAWVVDQYLLDELPPGHVQLGLEDGVVSLSKLGGHLSEETIAETDELRAAIKESGLDIPDVPANAPTHLPETTVQIDASYDGQVCAVAAPEAVELGTRIRFNFTNTSGEEVAFFADPDDDDFEPSFQFGHTVLITRPNGTNASTATPSYAGPWVAGCLTRPGADPIEAESWDITPSGRAARTITFDGGSCGLANNDAISANTPFLLSNTGPDDVEVAILYVADDVTATDIQAGVGLEPLWSTDAEPDDEYEFFPPLTPGARYFVNCYTGEVGVDAVHYPMGVIDVVG